MIFFDIDDTLLNFRDAELNGVKEIYDKGGFYCKDNFNNFISVWSKIKNKYFDMYLQNKCTFKERQIAQVVDLFNYYNIKIETEPYDYFLIYYNAFESSWKVYDDVFPALSKISFFKMGIISNGDDLQQRKRLEMLGINKYFNDVITSGKFGISKPSRKIFDMACERNNVNLEECYYIGDKIKQICFR